MTRIGILIVAAALAAFGSAACGDDTSVAPSDAGKDVTQSDGPNTNDSPTSDGNTPMDGSSTDSGDGGPCDFAVFVTGLIQNHTNSTDQPSTDLGQNCTDQMQQSQFAPLFP
jgi:hypothetical protein